MGRTAVHSMSLIPIERGSWRQVPITLCQQDKIEQAALAHHQRCTLVTRKYCTAHTQGLAAHPGWGLGCLSQLQGATREATSEVWP